MTRDFELTGTTKEKFKQIELVMQRVRRRNTKRILTVPPSIICFQVKDFNTPYRCLLFAGRVEKLSYSFLSVTNNEKAVELDLTCNVISGNDTRAISIKGKRLKDTISVGVDLTDGAIITVQSNDSNIRYDGGLISILYTPDFTSAKLTKVDEDEGV